MVVSDGNTRSEPIAVLYAGYLQIFGSVGAHPQFHHITNPPPGYEFVQADPISSDAVPRIVRGTVKLVRLLYLLGPTAKLLLSARRKGAKPYEAIRFMRTRGGFRTQAAIPKNTRLAFLPTWPYILGQVPWVIEIEDVITLFAPFIRNGHTSSIEICDTPFYPVVKALIESDSCRGIICHVKSTADSIPLLFKNQKLREKIVHVPLGIVKPPVPPERKKQQDDVINILFTNSWHQDPTNFYLRGGLDLLEAFTILSSKYPNIRLILRTRLPSDLDGRYLSMIKENWRIKVMDQILSFDDMKKLMLKTDIYVLPSARVHVVSILEAMAYGIAVVVSDGWGIEEYVENGWNGIITRGRYGKCSWMDTDGMLKEDYTHLFSTDPFVVDELVDSLSTLLEDQELRERLGQNGRRDVENKFSLNNWNKGLKRAFDQALS